MTREEAIEAVKAKMGYYESDKRLRAALETLITELCESEDERIRKGLIEALKTTKNIGELKFILPEPTREDAIAYLEKQKEQEPFNVCEQCPYYKDCPDYNEQRPAEWSDTDELVFQDICKHLNEEGYSGWVVLLNALRNGEFQPKQEWSEEDENTINIMIAILRENHPNGLFKTNPVNTTCMSAISTDMLIKRIESLRPVSKESLQSHWKPSEEQN